MATNDWLIGLTAGLDDSKSREQIKKDIEKLRKTLDSIEFQVKLSADQKKEIKSQLDTLEIGLDNVSISESALKGLVAQVNNALSGIKIAGLNVGDSNITEQAQKIGNQIETQITNNVSQGFTEGLKSFSELKVGEDTTFGIIFNKEGLVDAEKTLKEIKETYSKFGQVKITNEIFDSGELKEFKVNIQQVNGDLKETRSFMMSLSDDGKSFIPTNDIIKGSENIVHHLDEAKNATNKIVTEEEKLAEQMSKIREKTQLTRQAEEKRQELAQNNAINKALEEEYAEKEKLADQISKFREKTELARQAEEKRQELAQNNAINKALEKEYAEREKIAEQASTIIEDAGNKGKTTTNIQLLRDNFTKLGLSADEVKSKMSGVDKEFSQLKEDIAKGDNNKIVAQFNQFNTILSQTQNDLKVTRSEYSQLVSTQQRLSKANVIEAWNLRNSKATSEVRAANEAYIASLRDLNSQMTKMQFNEIVNGFKRAENSMRGINRLGANIKDQFKQAFQTIAQGISVVNVVRTGMNYVQKMPSIVTELDTSLVDLAKTADMSADELKDFYYASNDVAKQMGVTTNEILTQASAWSRLGFNTAESATQMAKLSSMFKLISPGMNIDDATSGLVSIMKAYDIDVDDVLDGIMSKVNIIGNNFALSNADIVAMLQDSVSAMAESNNTLEETIALETAAFEIVQDQSVGNGFKTVALRIRGINEETQELDETLTTIKSDLYDLTGVSVMQDANTYKSTYQILKEISGVWDNLTDKTQAETLELMFGKLRSNIGASVIKNFSAAEKAMNDMANSAGNAEAEMSIMADSVSYKLNKLQETGTGIAQNLFDRDDMKSVLDFFNSLAKVLDFATEKLGLFGTIGLGTGIAASVKNVGRDKM